MEYDQRKIEEVVVALLGALEFENGRVWKRFDFEIMDALHEKGLITDPRGRHESVYLTDEGKVLDWRRSTLPLATAAARRPDEGG